MKSSRFREVERQLRRLCPQMPLADFAPVAAAACDRRLRHLPPTIALWQSLSAHIRHVHSDYDALLAEGYDRDSARHFVADQMNAVLDVWGCKRKIDIDDA